MSRTTRVSRDVKAGCETCHGSGAHWFGGQAQGTAAKHHDQTGHTTWCEVYMHVTYGGSPTKGATTSKAAAGFVGLPPRGSR
jgi:hypothetical protein